LRAEIRNVVAFAENAGTSGAFMDGQGEKGGAAEQAEIAFDLNFVPTWARKPPDRNPYADGRFEGRDVADYERRERDRGGERRGRFGDRRGPRRDRDDRGPRAPARDTPRDRASPRPEREPSPRFAGPPSGERPAPSPVEIHFIPERRSLGAAVHRIHAAHRAYPLSELAHFFLSKPEFCAVKFDARRGVEPPVRFYQCAECQSLFLDRTQALDHAIGRHADRFFEARETQLEPPQGQFICVARCRRSGRLLGPPNHHAYNENLLQARAEVAPDLSLDEYRQQIETVRDPEAIERWKQEASRATLYHRRDAPPDAPPLKWHEARALLRDQLAPTLIREAAAHATVPAPVALALEDARLRAAVREAWTLENRFPMSLMYALRPALRHMGLHLFKAGDAHTFVTAVAPAPLDPERAIPPIRDALKYLGEHPGVTRAQMLQDLFPGRAPDDPELRAVVGHLHWLVEKGHVIEFFDGTLSVPRRHRADSPPAAERP